MKMKFFIAVLILIVSPLLKSHSDSLELKQSNPNINSLTILEKPDLENNFTDYDFNSVGIKHNEGLSYIYLQLKNLNFTDMTPEDIYAEIFNNTERFLLNDKDFKDIEQNLLVKLRPDLSSSELIPSLKNNLTSKISSTFLREKINSFENIFNKFIEIEHYTSMQVTRDLKSIDNDIKELYHSLDNKEYVAVRALIATAISSIDYWELNLVNWSNLGKTNSGSKHGWSWFKKTIGKMAVADAYGAAVGAVVGFVSTIGTGPGALVGMGAGAVGYGLNSSAVAGVREFVISLKAD